MHQHEIHIFARAQAWNTPFYSIRCQNCKLGGPRPHTGTVFTRFSHGRNGAQYRWLAVLFSFLLRTVVDHFCFCIFFVFVFSLDCASRRFHHAGRWYGGCWDTEWRLGKAGMTRLGPWTHAKSAPTKVVLSNVRNAHTNHTAGSAYYHQNLRLSLSTGKRGAARTLTG